MKGQRQVTGKKGELKVIGRLFEESFPVYTPVVDFEGVDCIIRNHYGILIELQIKSVGKDSKYPRNFAFEWNKKPRNNYTFIFYIEIDNSFYVIPSEYLAGKDGKQIYGPDKKGVCSVDFTYPKFKEMYIDFKDNWERLNHPIN